MDLLEVGKIVNTHGLRGEVKIVPWTDYPEQFEDIDRVYVEEKNGGKTPFTINRVKYQKNNLILSFKELNDINDAEKYKNKVLYAERSSLGDLPPGVYYIADLIGLKVITDDGRKIGHISDVINNGASDIYVVKREGMKDLLLPVIDDVVISVDLDSKAVMVHMIDGLEDLG